MIISHKHKFIYFKSCKAAGTSIEVFLSAYCGEDDIITNIGEPTADWHVARNGGVYYKHSFASEVRAQFNKRFDEYYKFTSVRHPIDKMISLYYWWKGKGQIKDEFNTWVSKCEFPYRATFFYPFYSIDEKMVVNDLVRVETIKRDLKRVCKVLGIDYDEQYLLHYKKREREHLDISDASIRIIEHKFRREYKDLGYADFVQT